MKLALYAIILILIGCQPKPQTQVTPPIAGAPWITKSSTLYPNRMESTPVVWTDGSLLDIVSKRNMHTTDISAINGIEIYQNHLLISTLPGTFGFISAIVSGGKLHVFGTYITNPRVVHLTTSNLLAWDGPEVTVIVAPAGYHYYNSSVTPDATGFKMSLDFWPNSNASFTVIFLTSSDLDSWAVVPGAQSIVECPALRYSNGWYYLLYTMPYYDEFVVYIERSHDLVTWVSSSQPILAPTEGEGDNNSDIDLVELNGQVLIRYAVGYQIIFNGSFVNIREATYNGSMDDFFEEFFK